MCGETNRRRSEIKVELLPHPLNVSYKTEGSKEVGKKGQAREDLPTHPPTPATPTLSIDPLHSPSYGQQMGEVERDRERRG